LGLRPEHYLVKAIRNIHRETGMKCTIRNPDFSKKDKVFILVGALHDMGDGEIYDETKFALTELFSKEAGANNVYFAESMESSVTVVNGALIDTSTNTVIGYAGDYPYLDLDAKYAIWGGEPAGSRPNSLSELKKQIREEGEWRRLIKDVPDCEPEVCLDNWILNMVALKLMNGRLSDREAYAVGLMTGNHERFISQIKQADENFVVSGKPFVFVFGLGAGHVVDGHEVNDLADITCIGSIEDEYLKRTLSVIQDSEKRINKFLSNNPKVKNKVMRVVKGIKN